MTVVKKPKTAMHPSVLAMCEELGIDSTLVQQTLEGAERRSRKARKGPLKGTPGYVLAKFAGTWQMTDEEWDRIYADIRRMREIED